MALPDRGLAELTVPVPAGGTRRGAVALLALFALLATLHTWPMPSDPAHLTRLDNDDTAFNTWVVAWVGHQIVRDPLRLFDAPIFYPAPRALAFSEHMVVQGAMGAPLQWLGAPPALVYNVLVWLGLLLSGWAMALLIRAWTGSFTAGVVAGCLYAFNAHTLTRYAHLQALHLQFLPAVLFLLDRLLRRGSSRPGRDALLLAAVFALQALCSNYMLVMMAAAVLAGASVRGDFWRAPARTWGTLALAAAVAAVLLWPFLWPYYQVRTEQGLVRTMDDVRRYSAGWLDYLTTAGRLHYAWWSHRLFEGRTALFPGVAGLALAIGGVMSGAGWRDRRVRMAMAFGLLGLALSFGASLPGYAWMHEHLPLLQGVRAVARWGVLPLMAVAVLSGFAVAALERRWQMRRWWPAVAVALVAVVTLEALRAPLPMTRFDGIPEVHARLAQEQVRALVVFPLYGGADFNRNAKYLLDQTRHWKPMLNAYSSFAPPIFYTLAERLQRFPGPDAIAALREHGFSHVVLHRAPLERAFGGAAVDGLRGHTALAFAFEQDGVIVYRLR